LPFILHYDIVVSHFGAKPEAALLPDEKAATEEPTSSTSPNQYNHAIMTCTITEKNNNDNQKHMVISAV
jgi:hypothetical protein